MGIAARYSYEQLRSEYAASWARMVVTKEPQATAQANRIKIHKDRYKAVEEMTGRNGGTKVPWFVVGVLHMRESGGDFNTWLHNGDPMRDKQGRPVRTVQVPPHRPVDPNCSWEEGAFDALVICEHLDQIDRWCPERVAYAAEKFNGFGYRSPARNIPTPYDWGGTNIQKRGKFTGDNKYDASVMDPQIGAMAVLKELMQIDPEAVFTTPVVAAASLVVSTDPKDVPSQMSPKAGDDDGGDTDADALVSTDTPKLSPHAGDTTDEVKPLVKSKTVWGGLMGYATTVGSTVFGLFEKLDNPYTLTAFIVIIVVASGAAYLVIKGRIDVNKIVEHLADSPPETGQET